MESLRDVLSRRQDPQEPVEAPKETQGTDEVRHEIAHSSYSLFSVSLVGDENDRLASGPA